MSLNFEELRAANVARCNQVFFPLESWSLPQWGNSLAGEVGEACNVIKKIDRDGPTGKRYDDLVEELADVLIYADLLAARAGINLGEAVEAKFNKVSVKRLSNVFLPARPEDSHEVKPGTFIRIRASNGSYGQVTDILPYGESFETACRYYGKFYYGRNNAGEFTTASFGIPRKEFLVVTREEFWAVANRRPEDTP